MEVYYDKYGFFHTGGGRDMILSRLVFAILLLLGFTTNAFASGGGGGGGGNKYQDLEFRCLKKIGAFISNQKNYRNEYCIPKVNFNVNWEWSLDGRDDSTKMTTLPITECFADGSFSMESKKPVNSHSYCVPEADFDKVTKCVNKTTGKDVSDRSKCENDMAGAIYYYKPKCSNKDSKESCEIKLKAIAVEWRFCHNTERMPLTEKGGQSVYYRTYKNSYDNPKSDFPCEQQSRAPSGGSPVDSSKLEGLIIRDSWDSESAPITSKIHTKISGNGGKTTFKLIGKVAVDKKSVFDSGLKEASCKIDNGSFTPSKSGVNLANGLVKEWSASEDDFKFSGKHKITCKATDTNGKQVETSVEFISAPYQYSFEAVNASFDSSGKPVLENLLTNNNSKAINLIALTNKQVTHFNNSWTKKPVVKIGELLGVRVGTVKAYNAKGDIDTGVDHKDGLSGAISVSANPKSTTKAIVDSSKMPPTTNQAGGACSVNLAIMPGADALMTSGIAQNSAPILNITADESLLATMEVEIYDKSLQVTLESELAKDKCKKSNDINSNGVCPFPPRLKLTFDYQIAPKDFRAELLDADGNPLKVLYYGQGTTPEVESGTKLKLVAIGRDSKNATKTFSKNCAAQDMQVSIETQLGNGIKVELVNKDNPNQKFSIVKASEFKDGEATIGEAIIKVTRGNDFTPALKAEPAFINMGELKSKTQFYKFAPYPTTYYPSYDGSIMNKDTDMVVLRARINAIDTDNSNLNSKTPDDTKVWYEFQCEYCNIDKVAQITGWNNGKGYTNADRSPTQQGWWIDRTFGKYNQNKITKSEMIKIESTNSNKDIRSVDLSVSDGLQKIQYGSLSLGTHKLNIRHYSNGDKSGDSMPNFLLYNAYWNANVRWNTSAFIYVKGKAADDKRNYGVDTGGAKNTRSGGRTGKF